MVSHYATIRARSREVATTAGALFLLGAWTYPAESLRIERRALEEHVLYLASDELEGRGNGTSGLKQAAGYISQQLERVGLVPAGEDGTYFQVLRVMIGHKVGRHTRAVFRHEDREWSLEYPSDFEPMTFSAAAEIRAPLVFAGYGVTAPEHDYDDYRDVDVKGKVVLVLRYVPGHALGRGPFEKHGWHATFVRKARNALGHGAKGVILVNGPLHHRKDKLVPFGVDVGAERLSIPVMHLSRDRAEKLLRSKGIDFRNLQRRIDENVAPESFELDGVEVELSIDVRRKTVEVPNVLGYLPPSNRGGALSSGDEHVILGAHYDHLGLGHRGSRERRGRGKIHNGADDNASGVAGVLELARLFAAAEDRPRGLLVAAFAGEELGLRGSHHYTVNPSLDLQKAVAMINLDMIGRLRHDRIYLGGVELLPDMNEVIERYTDSEGLSYSTRFTAEAASDHAPFIRAGVPALFFFTGLHGDYHKPSDDAQFINFDGMERVIRLGYHVIDYLLRAEERPALNVNLSYGARGADRSETVAYLGVGVDNDFEGEGVRFAYVARDGPAAAAGLQTGDVLLEIDGREVHSSEAAAVIIQQHRPGETLSVRVRRGGEMLRVTVRLSEWP